MKTKNIIEKNPSNLKYYIYGLTSDKMNLLYQFIHKHSDIIEATGSLREKTDKIHSNYLSRTIRNSKRLKKTSRKKIARLISLV